MNPYALAQKAEEKYLQYLKTMFYFKDAGLRKSFEDVLNAGHLSNGPYLEATPVFKRAKKPSELFAETLGFKPDEGFLKAIDGDRPLYCHQEDAIRFTAQNKNVVVATGTGSGKTEAFLLPILLHLYKEFKAGQLDSGVRALILYPMNALAFDQRERLGKICTKLKDFHSDFRFTFGQYVGDTPDDRNDRQRNAREALDNRLPGELVLRDEMRSQPPHILLTNYSMLEFMLLRPKDTPLFDNGNAQWWKFIVLDEAHQYRGTKGMEMGMLLRRLKQRLCEGGRQNGFLCIATSATLSSDTKDKTPVAKFAQDLFGEPFEPEHIITGQYEKLLGGNEVMLNPTDYKQLENARSIQVSNLPMELSSISFKLGIDLKKEQRWQEAIYTLLQKDARATSLREKIVGHTIKVDELAKEIFPELRENDEKVEPLVRLIHLLVSAESPVDGSPLLTGRFHFFLRSLEGAYLSLAEANNAELNQLSTTKILLDRTSLQPNNAFFEVALCRECGQHYLVGKAVNGKLQEAIRDPGDDEFGANFFRPIDMANTEQDDDFNAKNLYQLCLTCAALSRYPMRPDCKHDTIMFVEQQESSRNQPDQVSKCAACGFQAPDPVREIVHGSDGPNAVIATALVQNLPNKKKKVLAFADSRQQAAFFAWYVEDSYQSILTRALILHALKELSSTEPISFNTLASKLSMIHEKYRLFPETSDEIERISTSWKQVYSEFLTEETNQSLEGVGLVRYTMKWPSWLDIGNFLNDLPFSGLEKYKILETLLSFLRSDKAVELKSSRLVNLNWSDLGVFSPQMNVRIGEPHNQRNVRSWDGENGRRARWLARVLENAGIDKSSARADAVTALRTIWQAFLETDRRANSPNERILCEINDAKRLNPDWWRIQLVENKDAIYQCLACGRLQHASVKDVCNRSRCHGKLIATKLSELELLEPNHYQILYKELNPERLRVEEHTAQLTKGKAREYQRDFRENKIQVLSCSTTFELGVDLGDLDTVFLRNVPPESFNYAQRVGRAGRRTGNIGFAITYCRRNAHDLYHFDEPGRMISGKVNPPAISKKNEKITIRHLTATALSFFFRESPSRFDCVEAFFVDLSNPSALRDFKAFLEKEADKILASLKSIIADTNQQNDLGLNDGTWIEHLASAALDGAEARVNADFKTVKSFENESSKLGNHLQADWAKRRANTIAKEDVLSFLSRTVVIPKYGFPVDVVQLDTHHLNGAFESDTVTLERDLSIAIAEFAPTSKLVANKFEWQSYALKKVAEKEWSRWHYARCAKHHRFERWQHGQNPNFEKCCNHMTTRQYVVPQFGFQTKRGSYQKPQRKTERIFSTRPYFVGFKSENQQIIKYGPIELTKTSPGEMTVLCEGYKGHGFYICSKCGTGFREMTATAIQNGHDDFLGRKCNYQPQRFLSLGHDFVTDILKLTFNKPYSGDIEPYWFAFTLAYTILEGASKVLDVPSNELNVTVHSSGLQGIAPAIILYDNVPGGAGLVARLEVKQILFNCLKAALDRVDGHCGCAPETTCYGCLRSYRNQFAHSHLQRGAAYTYLLELLKEST
ncbi:DEAD/DEAH box helicase [candidate division KSB1 bacterium]|nr:DEAD/DEAH box helicase [candidate division KSB1 bacterium]